MATEQTTIPDDDLLPEERALMQAAGKTTTAPETGLDEEPAPVVAAADATDTTTAAAEGDPAAKAAEPAPTAEALAEIAAEEPAPAAPAPAAKPMEFRVASQEAIEADMLALETEKAEAFQKVMSGDMEPAEYTKLEAATNRKIGKLQAQATLAEVNAQNADHAEKVALRSLMTAAKASGQIDYMADSKAQAQFDTFLDMALADPDNADKPFAEVAQEAHAAVLAFRGVAHAAAPAPAPAPAAAPAVAATPAAPAAPKPRDIPQTLATLPAAAAVNVGNDFMTQFNAITDPDEADALLASMPKAQRQALMRSTMPH